MTFRQVDDVIRGFVLSGYRNALSKLGKQQKNFNAMPYLKTSKHPQT